MSEYQKLETSEPAPAPVQQETNDSLPVSYQSPPPQQQQPSPYQQPPGGYAQPPAPMGYQQQPAGPYNPQYASPQPQYASPQAQYGAAPVVATQYVVQGGCPRCHGYMNDDFTCLGICCAIVFFPIGLLCCLLMKERKCGNCGYTESSYLHQRDKVALGNNSYTRFLIIGFGCYKLHTKNGYALQGTI